jgi:hypothetical protein
MVAIPAAIGAAVMPKSWRDKAKNFLLGDKPISSEEATLRNDALLQDEFKRLIGTQAGRQQLDRRALDNVLAGQGATIGRMQGLEGSLQGMIAGRGGAGTMAAERSLLTGQRNLQSMAASQRGVTAGSSMREAARQSAILAAEGAGQVGQVRAQEQEQAQGALAALLGQQAGLQGQRAGLEAGLSGTNLQALLGQQVQADQMRLAGMTGLQGLDEAEKQRQLAIMMQNQKPGALGSLVQVGLAAGGAALAGPGGGQAGMQAGGAMAPAFQGWG